jgi:uncharacterized protein YegL
VANLCGDPQALETAWLSVITFGDDARQTCPLTELLAFEIPQVRLGGGAALGAGLRLLEQCLDREVRKATPTQKGDWKPLVILLTNGQPSDEWKPAAERIRQKRPAAVLAITTGPAVGATVLEHITDRVIPAENLLAAPLSAFFRWVSASVLCSSTPVSESPTNPPPPPPSGITIVP